MSDPLTKPKARCSAFLEVQRKTDISQTVTTSEIAEILVKQNDLSPEEAETISTEVIEILSATLEYPNSPLPSPSYALEALPTVITRFGEEWRLADESETLALYDCFNRPSGTHRGQVVLIKRWRDKERKLPSGVVQPSGSVMLPAAKDFGHYAWNFRGDTAGRRRFEELKAG